MLGQVRERVGCDGDVVGDGGVVVDHYRQGTLVCNGGVPFPDALLCETGGEEAWRKTETPCRARVFGDLELFEGFGEGLRSGACDEGVVGVVVFGELGANCGDEGFAFGVGEGDGFASGAEEDEASDSRGGKVKGVFCLGGEVQGRGEVGERGF